MNRVGVLMFLAQRLKHVPRSLWIAAGFAERQRALAPISAA